MLLAAFIVASAALVGVLALAIFFVALHTRQENVERTYRDVSHLPLEWANVQQQLRSLAGRVDKRAAMLAKSQEQDPVQPEQTPDLGTPASAPALPFPPGEKVFTRHDLLASYSAARRVNGHS